MTPRSGGPHAVILTEAGPGLGLGHLGRCIALAEALEECGARARLFVRGIDRVPEQFESGGFAESTEWLDELPSAVIGSDIAIVDSYEATGQLYARVAGATHTCVWLDDTRRLDYPPGLIVDGGINACERRGERVTPGTVLLLGARFQPLRRPFWTPDESHRRDDVQRILVVMGGTDVRGLGPRVTTALSAGYPSATVDLVEGRRSASGMARSMAAADLCVTAAGQTLFELAALGVPAVGIIVADNQRMNAEGWADAGFLRLAGTWHDFDLQCSVVKAVRELLPRDVRERSGRVGRAVCDGRGALRVAARAVGAWRASSLIFRRVCSADEAALLDVSNDPEVRAASFESEPILAEQHHAWLEERLQNRQLPVFVIEDGFGVAGVVRFAIEENTATVSIALGPRLRGEGLAVALLERGLAEVVVARPDVTKAVALVRAENAASRALFAASGFTEQSSSRQRESQVARFVRSM